MPAHLLRFCRFLERRSPSQMAAILAAIFFLVQLSMLGQYGVTWDEPLHRNWGHLTFLFLSGGLDRSIISAMPGNGMYYGTLYYLLNYLFSEALLQTGLFSFVGASHVLNLLTAAFIVGVLYWLVASVASRKLAFLTLLYLVFFPQFLAHAHYNPKDFPVAVGVLCMVAVFIAALRSGRRRSFIVAGALFGLAVSLKVTAVLMIPSVLVAYAAYVLERRTVVKMSVAALLRQESVTVVLAGLAALIALFVSWPTLWNGPGLLVDSIHFFLSSDFWAGKQMFFGAMYSGAELPWYYIPVEFVMAMPVLSLIAFALGVVVLIRRIHGNQERTLSLFLLSWIVFPLLYSMKPGLVRYDGMRQFYFVLPAVAWTAAIGLSSLLALLRRRVSSLPWLTVAVCILIVLDLFLEVALVHPFEGSYRNELVRLFIPSHIEGTLEIEYWGSPYKQGLDWLNLNAVTGAEICVPTATALMDWYTLRPDLRFGCDPQSTYVMFITRFAKAAQFSTREPVFTISRYRSDLLRIYKLH